MSFGKPPEELHEKLSFRQAVSGLSATLAAATTDTSTERSRLFAHQTHIVVEVAATFNALATDGLRVRLLEYFTTASATTNPTSGSEGTIAISAGNTVKQTFHFEVLAPYYQIELRNLDAAQSITSIAVNVIESPVNIDLLDGPSAYLHYFDGSAWKTQGQVATEVTLAEISDNVGDKTDAAAAGTGDANAIQLLKQAEINLTAIETAVEVMDDWDESDRAKVNLIVGQAGIAAGAGADGVTVPRVSLATDVPLPAGTNAIGKLASNTGVDIGDVDVTSLPVGNAAMASSTPVTIASDDTLITALKTALEILDNAISGNEMQVDVVTIPAPLNVVGGGTEATAQRVTLANDSTGVVSVDDNAGSLTVDQATHDSFNANANIQVNDTDVSATNPVVIAEIPKTFTQALTVTAGLYAVGDNVGGKITLTSAARASGGTVRLNSIVLADHDEQEAEMDITFFNANPSGSTLTNDAATDVVDADAGKIAGTITISPAHYYDLGSCSVANIQDINMLITASGSANLYCAVTTRGTPTFTATDHVNVIINLEQL